MTPARVAAWLLACGLLLAGALRAADYRRSYLDGLQSLRAGDWQAAIAALSAAIAEQPQERARARMVGVIPEPYLPHHYLGMALFGAHRCPDALAAWRLSAGQGAIDGVPTELAAARQGQSACETLGRAEAAVERARGADRAVTARGGGGPRQREALGELAAAQQELGAGVAAWNFATIGEAGRKAEHAVAILDELAAIASPTEPPAATVVLPPTAPAPPPAADPTSPLTPPVEPAAQPAARVPAPLQPELIAAIQDYFDGNYEQSIAGLRGFATSPGTRADFFQNLFRGASLYALYLLGGERDVDLYAEAREDLGAARRADPRFRPTARDFSPRFLELYSRLQ